MKFRREDSNKYDLTATMTTDDETGKPIASMTSVAKPGIGAEDLLGTVIKMVEATTGATMYVTLTSSAETSRTVAGARLSMVLGYGVVNHAINGSIMMVMFEHTEEGKVVTENLTINANRSAT